MATAQQQVQWGALTITLDTKPFAHAYTIGREHYFDTLKEEPYSVHMMAVHQVMGLVAIPDDAGNYQFDDDPANAEEILGFTLGYMSGPVLPETVEECEHRLHRYERHAEHMPVSVDLVA